MRRRRRRRRSQHPPWQTARRAGAFSQTVAAPAPPVSWMQARGSRLLGGAGKRKRKMEANLRDHWKQLAKEEESLRQEEARRREKAAASAVEWQTKAENEENGRRAAEQKVEQWKQEAEKLKQEVEKSFEWKQEAEQFKEEVEKWKRAAEKEERLGKETEKATLLLAFVVRYLMRVILACVLEFGDMKSARVSSYIIEPKFPSTWPLTLTCDLACQFTFENLVKITSQRIKENR